MPRYLAIDWDPPNLNVLGVSSGKGKARVEQSLAFALPQELTASSASALGRALKDALGQANLAAAPVLVSLGRDRVILKEMTIPFVPAHEEAAVVRFQAAKELTEAASEVVLDYAHSGPPKAGQPTRVQVVIVRKAIVAAVTALCQSAGLKLAGIVPRPFALAGLLDRRSTAGSSTRGLLVPTAAGEVDFCVYANGGLVWARTLAAGPDLATEVSRNVTLLAAQKSDLPELQSLETAGLADLGVVGVPKEQINPWRDGDARPANPVPFLAPLGLAELAARSSVLPVNLAAPKEPRPVADDGRRRKKFALVVAGVLAALLMVGWYVSLSQMRSTIKDLQEAKDDYDDKWKKREQDRLDVAALKEWELTTISWLDELYDISARMPHVRGLRINQVTAQPRTKQGANDKFTGSVTLHGVMNADQDVLVQQFFDSMQGDKYLRPQSPAFKANEFTLTIDVAPRPPLKFETPLVVPPRPKAPPSAEPTPEPIPEEVPPNE